MKLCVFLCVLLSLIFVINLNAGDMNLPTTDPGESALLMIEFQDEWLGADAKLAKLMKDKEQFENSKNMALRALSAARNSSIHIVHVGLLLNKDYSVLGFQNAKFGMRKAIQKYGTWDENACHFSEGFKPEPREFVVQGRAGASGFAGSNLDTYLKNNNIKRIYLAGYALNVCIESTLREGHDRGYEVIVLDDATSAFTPEQKSFFSKNIIHHFGALMSTETFIKNLN